MLLQRAGENGRNAVFVRLTDILGKELPHLDAGSPIGFREFGNLQSIANEAVEQAGIEIITGPYRAHGGDFAYGKSAAEQRRIEVDGSAARGADKERTIMADELLIEPADSLLCDGGIGAPQVRDSERFCKLLPILLLP